MCNSFRILVLAAGFASAVVAHPAIGIVRDADGSVFWSDLLQIWRLAPNGTKSVAVPGVHSHELRLDPEGNLFGEDLQYVNPGWKHRIWKHSRDGRVSDVIGWRSGFPEDYRDHSLHRDASGAMYWHVRRDRNSIVRKRPGKPPETLVTLDFNDTGWMTVLPEGTVLLAHRGDLLRVSPHGKVDYFARKVAEPGRHIMGMWPDAAGGLYVAAYGSAAVKRIAKDGRMTTLATSPAPWRPTGGTLAPDGTLWILEESPDNAQRVRKVSPSGAVQVY